jgi:serine protease Do
MKNVVFKKWSNSIIIVAIVSLIIGALAGALSGLAVVDSLMNENFSFFTSPIYQIFQPSQDSIQDSIVDSVPLDLEVDSDSEKTIKAVEKINPAVVSIVVSKYVSSYYSLETYPFGDDFFNDFFNDPFRGPSIPTPVPNKEQPKEKQEVGGGTGFVVSAAEGLILTNKHVVTDEEAEYSVITNEGKKYEAEVLARDPFNDMAILKISAIDLPEIKLGDSDQIKLGESVIAIGNALGEFRNTVTKGVISGISRRIEAGDNYGRLEVLEDVIQTDAAINFGNSGGPLINLQGEVIGINTAISSQGQLIGFAIPINQAKQVINSVKEHGRIIRPFLGVRYVIINKEIAEENNLPYDYGALIIKGEKITDLAVIPGSPANKAGLEENDIILEIEGKKITQNNSLAKEIQKHQPGEEISLKVYHQGEEKEIKAVLDEYGD